MGYESVHKEVFCDRCQKMIERQFRFTDWYEDRDDVYGDFDCCLTWFKQAIAEEPEGRYSIYAVTICPECDSMLEDEGVVYNDNCPDYNLDGKEEVKMKCELCGKNIKSVDVDFEDYFKVLRGHSNALWGYVCFDCYEDCLIAYRNKKEYDKNVKGIRV